MRLCYSALQGFDLTPMGTDDPDAGQVFDDLEASLESQDRRGILERNRFHRHEEDNDHDLFD